MHFYCFFFCIWFVLTVAYWDLDPKTSWRDKQPFEGLFLILECCWSDLPKVTITKTTVTILQPNLNNFRTIGPKFHAMLTCYSIHFKLNVILAWIIQLIRHYSRWILVLGMLSVRREKFPLLLDSSGLSWEYVKPKMFLRAFACIDRNTRTFWPFLPQTVFSSIK